MDGDDDDDGDGDDDADDADDADADDDGDNAAESKESGMGSAGLQLCPLPGWSHFLPSTAATAHWQCPTSDPC